MSENSKIRPDVNDYMNSLPRSRFVISPPGSPTGEPDVKGVLDGRHVEIEVKVPGKKPKKHQAYVLKQTRLAGGIAFSATSVEEVEFKLKLEGYEGGTWNR